MSQLPFSHTSVLLYECIEALNIRDGYTYVDCTTGGGGHSLEIARRLGHTAMDWQIYVEKIEKLPESEAVEIQDFLLGAAQKCTPDANGRIILDERLASHAGIDKNVIFVGAGRQIRIWAEETWNEPTRY